MKRQREEEAAEPVVLSLLILRQVFDFLEVPKKTLAQWQRSVIGDSRLRNATSMFKDWLQLVKDFNPTAITVAGMYCSSFFQKVTPQDLCEIFQAMIADHCMPLDFEANSLELVYYVVYAILPLTLRQRFSKHLMELGSDMAGALWLLVIYQHDPVDLHLQRKMGHGNKRFWMDIDTVRLNPVCVLAYPDAQVQEMGVVKELVHFQAAGECELMQLWPISQYDRNGNVNTRAQWVTKWAAEKLGLEWKQSATAPEFRRRAVTTCDAAHGEVCKACRAGQESVPLICMGLVTYRMPTEEDAKRWVDRENEDGTRKPNTAVPYDFVSKCPAWPKALNFIMRHAQWVFNADCIDNPFHPSTLYRSVIGGNKTKWKEESVRAYSNDAQVLFVPFDRRGLTPEERALRRHRMIQSLAIVEQLNESNDSESDDERF
jgi:hypothetical protein